MLGGVGSPGGDDFLTVTVIRDEHGYGMKVSGDNPVYVQSVKEHGAAWRAGLRAGDRILRVDAVPVLHHTHQQVVHMIRANPTTVLTVQQNTSRLKTPITAPVPVNSEKQRQLEVSKVHTMRLMLEKEQKFIRDLRNELTKVPDVRKQAQLESAEQRCSKLQHEIDTIMVTQHGAGQPEPPSTPRSGRKSATNSSFLSGLPRSLSNLTGQSIRSLRQRRPEETPALLRQSSDEVRRHNNTVPLIPTTCLDNVTPPPLPPRERRTVGPPVDHVRNIRPIDSRIHPMHRSMPSYEERFRRSSRSLDGELEGPQPNSIAMQMNYPLVNAPPPPLQTDDRTGVPVLHVRSRSSPEQLDHDLTRPDRVARPPGTPPPPYRSTQPCADPQRAIISMEEDDSPASDNSTYSGLFSNLRSVRESNARSAVLLNWLLGERRCACALLLLVVSDGYRVCSAPVHTLRRWAYEIHSTFLVPDATLQLSGVDENMANEIEHVLVNEHDKEEILRNVFRKARQKAKDELSQQLTEFQVKRQVGLGTLYGPDDSVIVKCQLDKAQEVVVVEQLLCTRLRSAASVPLSCAVHTQPDAPAALMAALMSAALCLQARPAAVVAASGGSRACFLQRDKLYKQRLKQLAKSTPQPLVVRGHHLQLSALTAGADCHHCHLTLKGLAPQAYVCADCKLHVHRDCARVVEEGCCLDGEHTNNRISRFMERIHHNNQLTNLDTSDKKSRKSSAATHFLNMERSFRKAEDEPPWDQTLTPTLTERRDESDESLYESADGHSDVISASDDALPRLSKTPTISKESLKLAITDEEVDHVIKVKKGHRKTMSLSNPLEIVRNLGDEWFDSAKKELEKHSDKKKSKESLWSEEDRDSIHGSTVKLDQLRKNSKKEDKSQSNSRKSSTGEVPKTRKTSKGSSVSALNFLRRKKTPTSITKPVESVAENEKVLTTEEILNYTRLFLEGEKRFASISQIMPVIETDSEDEPPTPKPITDHRRRLSRQTSRSKSKARGKSQSLKVNTLRKSHSGTLKKGKKKSIKGPPGTRSRQASIVELTPMVKKKNSETKHQNWLFNGSRGESRREGSTDEPTAPDADVDTSDANSKDTPDKDNNWRGPLGGARGVNRAESCRERDAPRRGKHRNASDPNRLTAHNNHDLEPGAATAPSGSSSSSSLSSRSNESNTVAADQQASQSDLSEDEEPLAAQWADSIPPDVLDSLELSPRLRKRQEVIHELVVSEGSHVRWLRVLGKLFLRPLQQHGALPASELRSLFPNLPAIRDRHVRLYTDLKAARSTHIVGLRPIADALLDTLGESTYSHSVSKFCRGQRMALDALRERRRKSKELHQFLCAREQHPLCGRLQLRDMLACVWQRLTKYQLLLEGILKTIEEGEEDEQDVEQVRKALTVAKDVLQSVDTAIRTAENEHRLKTIQSKLEVRVPSPEWEELKRLDLTQHSLMYEGDLTLRNDANKRVNLLALMLSDRLVLVCREGDKFVLRPFPQPPAAPPHERRHTDKPKPTALSPIIKWDKVLFRPNAAVRNTFFLMNINGVQMHELCANSAPEYASWVKHIQEAPLAQLTELKSTITPSHHASRSNDDSGINVSRNPSDASEKSTSLPDELERSSVEREDKDDTSSGDKEEEEKEDKEDKEEKEEKEEKHKPRRPTVGRISTHAEPAPALEPPHVVSVRAPRPALTATTVYTDQERLRRLDAIISVALRAKSSVVGAALGVPPTHYTQLADLAVADAMGDKDVCESPGNAPELHQLLLAAHAQATQLTSLLQRALTVSPAHSVSLRARSGHCDHCAHALSADSSETLPVEPLEEDMTSVTRLERQLAEVCDNIDVHEEITCLPYDETESAISTYSLAQRLSPHALGLQHTLSRLLHDARHVAHTRDTCAMLRDENDMLRNRIDNPSTEEHFPKSGLDPSIQEQPSNGG